jgi:hypothetical protein
MDDVSDAGSEVYVFSSRLETPPRTSEDELAQIEWEEDMEMGRRYVNLTSRQMPPSWYPRWRKIQRLKDSGTAIGRFTDVPSWKAGRDPDDVPKFNEMIGFECWDNNDTSQDNGA